MKDAEVCGTDMDTGAPVTVCEVCGRKGKDARRCRFEKACSCWYGIPCKAGVSLRAALKGA